MSKKADLKRIKLSDQQLKSEIISLFNSGNTGKTDLYGLIRIKYTLARDRYFKMYDLCYSEWAKIKEEANTGVTIRAAEEAARIGLKSKIEKQAHLQKQIDDIQSDLDANIMVDYYYEEGVPVKIEKEMNVETKAYLRKTIKELYAELNKMEGDYAPAKIAQTDKNGEDIPIFNVTLNIGPS